eukprot:scaffold45842_cov42-Phaeocystis_antarctica.AAC.2
MHTQHNCACGVSWVRVLNRFKSHTPLFCARLSDARRADGPGRAGAGAAGGRGPEGRAHPRPHGDRSPRTHPPRAPHA